MKCPKCGSCNLHVGKKGYSLKKGAIGWFITGGVGLLGGLIGSNKIIITCLSCGHVFKAGDKSVDLTPNSSIDHLDKQKVDEYAETRTQHELQRGVKKPLAHTTCPPKSSSILKQKVICSGCDSLNELHFKFCRVCGHKIDLSSMDIVKNGQSFEYGRCSVCNAVTPRPSKKCKFCTNCGESLLENE